jgi:hypothetical protein
MRNRGLYGKFLVYPPNVKHSGFLVKAQKAAKQLLLGIWAPITAEELNIDLTTSRSKAC